MSAPVEEKLPSGPGAYAIFSNRSFTLYLFGSLLALMGTQGQGVAIGWGIYKRTGDPLQLGLVGLVQIIPMIVLTIPCGYLADLWDRRLVIGLSMIGSMFTSLGLAVVLWFGGSVQWMLVVLFFDATMRALGWPARQALMPLIVSRDLFPRAVTWRSSLMQMGRMVGPALGGIEIAYLGERQAYLIAAGTAALFALSLPWIRLRTDGQAKPAGANGSPSANGRMTWSAVLQGLRFVFNTKLLLAVISLDLFAVLLGGAEYLLPIYAIKIIHLQGVGLEYLGATADNLSEVALGWLRAAPGAGAFLMALMLAHLPPMKRAGRTLLLAVAIFGVVTIIFGLSRWFWLSMAMLFLAGAMDNISVVVRHTIVQMVTPDAMRGRVSAVNAVFISSSNELGGFESGLVAKFVGAVGSVVIGGCGTLVVVALMAWRVPHLRKLGRLQDVEEAGN